MDKKNAKVSEEISVREFFDMFKTILQLELLAGEAGLDRIIYEPSLNRPALAITGYYKNFASKRIQLFGAGEMSYLRDLSEERGEEVLKKMVELDIPCMIISRNLEPTESMLVIAEKHKVALIRTKMKSKEFSSEVLVRLGRLFSPRTTVHGTLIDINGIGTLIRGDSGIGKSECRADRLYVPPALRFRG